MILRDWSSDVCSSDLPEREEETEDTAGQKCFKVIRAAG